MTETFARTTFATSRAAEFLQARALMTQTGQPVERFGDVVAKELLDNSLDACETAGIAPDITLAVTEVDDHITVTVTDNGPGIPAEVVERMLDFNVLVSDKAAYRSPTRGAQGNAAKTILGMPFALGVAAPVVIEAHRIRHEITVRLDPGGNVDIRHDRQPCERTVGTSWTVPLHAGCVPSRRWLEKFAAANPHATLGQQAVSASDSPPTFYKATALDGWRKPLPTTPTSVWWYTEAGFRTLVFAHIGAFRAGGRDKPLGEFIREFDGLTSNVKARIVAAAVPDVKTLSNFADQPDRVGLLLTAMRGQARRQKPAALGRVGEDHLRAHMDAVYGVERFWYRRKEVDADGIGWVVEVAVAETAREGTAVWAVNYSPTFGDPLAGTYLRADDISSRGAAAFLMDCDAYPGPLNDGMRASVVHIITPAAEFTDKGKTALNVPPSVASMVAATLASAGKELRADKKRRERDARAEQRRREEAKRATPKLTIKAAVYAVMAQAIEDNRGPEGKRFPVRNLFYRVRDLVQRYGIFLEEKKHYPYFRDGIVQDYQADHGRIPGMYYDPRGVLVEPHSRREIPLGTCEIEAYELPSLLFHKIMYVEKKGFRIMFEDAFLGERHDMAIAYGQGQPVEAIRALFERATPGDYTLYVLHDADHSGYSIAHTIMSATPRMPGYNVEVVDLGLNVEQAIEWGLTPEGYTRRIKLPEWMPDILDERETEWFRGTVSSLGHDGKPNQWSCKRVELNALLHRLPDFVEAQLAAHGDPAKLIPPDCVIAGAASADLVTQVEASVDRILAKLIQVPTIKATLVDEARAVTDLASLDRQIIADAFAEDPVQPWRSVVAAEVVQRIDTAALDLRARVADLVSAQKATTPRENT